LWASIYISKIHFQNIVFTIVLQQFKTIEQTKIKVILSEVNNNNNNNN